MTTYPWATRCPIFSRFKGTFWSHFIFFLTNFPTSNRSKPTTVLTCKKSPHTDDRLPMGYSLPDFQQIWRNFLNSLHFFTKNWTSNRSKPIRVLTHKKSSCSDDQLSIGYSVPNFQPIWSNFVIRSLHSLTHFTTRLKGGRHGGAGGYSALL